MQVLSGIFFLSGSSLSLEVAVEVGEEGRLSVRIEDDVFNYVKGEYEIEPRLGSTKRVITFRDGARFETAHGEAFAELEKQVQASRFFAWVDWLERKKGMALACVVAVAAISSAFVYFGIPALAYFVANEVPQELREHISKQSLDTMTYLGQLTPTQLGKEEIERSQAAFRRAIQIAGLEETGYAYRLLNYQMGGVENAFALPSGAIVATDSFTRLCESEEQLVAVFLHEIAHVEEQHGIRSVVQRTGILVIASMVLGDISAVANVTTALPTLLIESQYSQRFEMESDSFAALALEESGIGVDALKEVLILLHRGEKGIPAAAVLSSHPSLQERVDNLKRIEARVAER